MRALPKSTLVAAGLTAAAVLLLVMAGPLYRIGLLPLPTAFALLGAGAIVGLIALIVAAITATIAYRRQRQTATLVAAATVVVALFAVGIPLNWLRLARSAPPIHDVSTDLENPPQFEAIVAIRGDAPNSLIRPATLSQQQRDGYPDLAPITVPRPLEETFDRAIAVAQDNGWEIVTADKSTGRIEATDTTRWFGFKDDVAVRLTRWGSGTRVDVRSVSRLGQSDVGTNARRVRRFLGALQAF